ncbi:MAG: tRNA (adenosine(37)-N6)-threonylcarbamoyltransferase complex dimerization subunit type 1 TsaB [Pseudomonadota bacterium]
MSRPDPVILAFDTSAAHCAAALLSGTDIQSRAEPMARGQAERLMPMLEELLEEAGVEWRTLDAVGVGIGPGNFTGLRISVAAARGIAQGLGVPAIGVSTFDAAAFQTADRPHVVVPAPRGMVYLRQGHGTDTSVKLISEVQIPSKNTLRAAEVPPTTLVCNIAKISAARLHLAPVPPAPMYVRPADAAPSSEPPVVILDDA